jgi:hypothetical protein
MGRRRPSGRASSSPGAQRQAPAERVARDDDRLVAARDVETAARHERVELLEDRPVAQRRRGAEARQVEGQRPPVLAREAVEDEPPGVGRVGVAVQQDDRRAAALELEDAGLVAGELDPVLEERLTRRHDGHHPDS